MPLNEPNLSRISFAIFSADLAFVPVDMCIAMSSASINTSAPSSLNLPPACVHFGLDCCIKVLQNAKLITLKNHSYAVFNVKETEQTVSELPTMIPSHN